MPGPGEAIPRFEAGDKVASRGAGAAFRPGQGRMLSQRSPARERRHTQTCSLAQDRRREAAAPGGGVGMERAGNCSGGGDAPDLADPLCAVAADRVGNVDQDDIDVWHVPGGPEADIA